MDSFLNQHGRQPRLYIDLPTLGKFYSHGVIEEDQYVQLPVYGMTAMDEISLKTPDALFSGLATANIIKSCIPAIKDPFSIVRLDLEYILIAIRIASFGETLDSSANCPKCNHENGFDINLSSILSNLENQPIEHSFNLDNLEFTLNPITYKDVTDNGIQMYSIQKQISNLEISKDKTANEHYAKFLQDILILNNKMTAKYIANISNGAENEENNEVINEYINNNEKKVADAILENISQFVKKWDVPELAIECQDSDCKHKFASTITVDYSNFFGQPLSTSRSLN